MRLPPMWLTIFVAVTMVRNLNGLTTPVVEGGYDGSGARRVTERGLARLVDHSVTSRRARVTAHFDGIEGAFANLCRSHEIVVGAVAWLTNDVILEALSHPRHVAIVVQKEDFLRRDSGVAAYTAWRDRVHHLYSGLSPFEPSDFDETFPGQQEAHPDYNATVQRRLFDVNGSYRFGGEAVRTLGYSRAASGRECPLMHHKFLVFGRSCAGLVMRPSLVATGSFNLTRNARRSRENVVVIEDPQVSQAYLSEWAQLWGMSESLDWSSPEPMPSEIDMAT